MCMSTSPNDDDWATRARSFGAVARAYDRARPSYPEALVDDVVAAGALLPGTAAVEVGAGTGKATVLFAVRGLQMTCVEPDPAMAAILRENTASLPHVKVVVAGFEDFSAATTFDVLIAAQSWHWTAPATRYDKAAELLHDGGLLALFWNRGQPHLTPLQPVLDEIYARHGLDLHNDPAGFTNANWPADELNQRTDFTDVEMRSYPSVQNYSTQQWCDYQASTSDHLILDPAKSRAVLTDVAQAIEDDGNGILELHRRCYLYLARRTAVPT
jgi:SAM-dependent methyltransferase